VHEIGDIALAWIAACGAAMIRLPAWLHRYNWHRPHGGIKLQTPISRLGLPEDNLLTLHT